MRGLQKMSLSTLMDIVFSSYRQKRREDFVEVVGERENAKQERL
jgi:hypothetical protein